MKTLSVICIWLATCLFSFGATGAWNGVAFTHWNGIAQTGWNGTTISCASGSSYLVYETFEGVGYAGGGTWNTGATADPDYTGVTINGSHVLRCNPSGVSTGRAYVDFTAGGTVFCFFRLYLTAGFSGSPEICTIRTSASARGTVVVTSGGVLRVQASGGSTNSSTDIMTLGTPLYVWVEYTTGTGADATLKGGWATTASKPTLTAGGTKTCVSSNGTGTGTDISRAQLGSSSTSTFDFSYDDLYVNPTAVP